MFNWHVFLFRNQPKLKNNSLKAKLLQILNIISSTPCKTGEYWAAAVSDRILQPKACAYKPCSILLIDELQMIILPLMAQVKFYRPSLTLFSFQNQLNVHYWILFHSLLITQLLPTWFYINFGNSSLFKVYWGLNMLALLLRFQHRMMSFEWDKNDFLRKCYFKQLHVSC